MKKRLVFIFTVLFLSFLLGCGETSNSTSVTTTESNQNQLTEPVTEVITTEMETVTSTSELITITFETNEGASLDPYSFNVGQNQNLPMPIPKAGYSFAGWYLDSEFTSDVITNTSNITESLTLYADYSINSYTATIKYYEYLDESLNFTQIENRYSKTVAITDDNKIFVWGDDYRILTSNKPLDKADLPIEMTHLLSLEMGDSIKKVSLTDSLTVVLSENGKLYAFGAHSLSELSSYSLDRFIEITDDLKLSEGETIKNVFCTDMNIFIETSQNRILGLGNNDMGQLAGVINTQDSDIDDLTNKFNLSETDSIKELDCDIDPSQDYYLLTEEGKLFVWLSNVMVNAGLITYDDASVYEINELAGLSETETIVSAAVQNGYIAFLTSNHRVMINKRFNELGLPDYSESTTQFVDITDDYNLEEGEYINHLISCFGSLYSVTSTGKILFSKSYNISLNINFYGESFTEFANDVTSYFDFQDGDYIIDIDGNDEDRIALTNQGKLYSWGVNKYATLGINYGEFQVYPLKINDALDLSPTDYIVDVSASEHFSIAITHEKKVFVWGINLTGGLGYLYDEHLIYDNPQDISNLFDFESDELLCKVESTDYNAVILTNKGSVYSWGRNMYGVIGNDGGDSLFLPENITQYFGLGETDQIENFFCSAKNVLYTTKDGKQYLTGINQEIPINILNYINLNQGELIIKFYGNYYGYIFLTNQGRCMTILKNSLDNFETLQQSDIYDIENSLSLDENETIVDIIMSNNSCYIITDLERIYNIGTRYDYTTVDTLWSYSGMPLYDLSSEESIDNIKEYGIFLNGLYLITDGNELYYLGQNKLNEKYLFPEISNEYNVIVNLTDFLQLDINENIEGLKSNYFSSVLFTDANKLFTTGLRYRGQIGNGPITSLYKPSVLISTSLVVEYDSDLSNIQPPNIEGYTFVGWYFDKDLSVEYPYDTMPAGNIMLYAKYEPNA